MDQNTIKQIQDIIVSGKNFLVVTKKDPSLDLVAASLGLYQALSQAGKITSIACSTPLTVELSNLFNVDKIETKIGNKNLVISLDYVDGSIEKVSYNVDGDKFNLIIQPKVGFPPFSPEKSSFSYSGISADAVFVIGAQNIEELDSIYLENKETFDTLPVININFNQSNSSFGKINLIDNSSSSCSSVIAHLLKSLSISIDPDTASNLLTGIETQTENFRSQKTTPSDFEAAAFCSRNGAKRFQFQGRVTKPIAQDVPVKKDTPVLETPAKQEASQDSPKKQDSTQTPPPDWLQPKIYKGGQLL